MRDDSTELAAISFWILLGLYTCFLAYAIYATKMVIFDKEIGFHEHQDYMKMFYIAADTTLISTYDFHF